jgi:hypothetical protein
MFLIQTFLIWNKEKTTKIKNKNIALWRLVRHKIKEINQTKNTFLKFEFSNDCFKK